MISTEDLRLAVTLSRSESLSAAARSLNVSPPALSMRLRKLEALLGITLASRDARRLSLTAEGERFARESTVLLEQLESLPDSFKQVDGQLTGTLRLAAPFGYGRQKIAPLLALFAKLHPNLCLHLDLREVPWPDRHDSDAVVHIGVVNDSLWVAKTLVPNQRWLCASPDYLKLHGIPQSPDELTEHRCICIRENEEDVTLWHLRRQKFRRTVRVAPAILTNDGTVARNWAEQGLGLVLRSQWDVVQGIANGALVRVLEHWQFESAPIVLMVPTKKNRSARVQALVRFLQSSLKA